MFKKSLHITLRIFLKNLSTQNMISYKIFKRTHITTAAMITCFLKYLDCNMTNEQRVSKLQDKKKTIQIQDSHVGRE